MGAEKKSTAEKLREARERRAKIREKVEELADKMGEASWNEDTDAPALSTEQRNWKQADDQVQLLESLLETERRDLGDSSNGSQAPITTNVIPNGNRDTPEGVRKRYSLFRAIRAAGGNGKLDGLELEMHQEGILEAKGAKVTDVPDSSGPGFMIPLIVSHDPYTERRRMEREFTERRDMLVGTATAGGHTVATNLGELIPFLDPAMRIRQLGARYLTGLVGNLDLPRRTARATGAWASEVAALQQSDPTFDKIPMTPKRLGTYVESSIQLFAQSSYDVENLIREDLQMCVAEALEIAALNGSGSSNQPTGILNTSGIGNIVGGTNGAVPDWSDIVDLETAVAQANAAKGRLAYYTTPGIAGKLKKTLCDVAGFRYIWEGPAAAGVGVVNGYGAATSTLVPSDLTKGTSEDICHAIIFGNWQELIIGQWAGLYIVVNPYSLDTNTEVRVSVAGWFDVAVRHAASFSAMKDALTA